ncbi:unnamed protein product [Knipowitschia caucasica]
MSNRSIAWWLRQIELPQYIRCLEGEYYGLEGLINVTNEELRAAGVEEEAHRQTIIQQLKRHRLRLEPHSGVCVEKKVSRKHSLGSSMDLVKPRRELFRQSVLPHLHQRADTKHLLSASCSQLQPLTEDKEPREEQNKRRYYHKHAQQ